jgi:hypothetical protein
VQADAGWEDERFSSKTGNKTMIPTFIIFIQCSQSNGTPERNNGIRFGKEVKLLLFADDKIAYIENPKDHMNTVKSNKQNQQSCRIHGIEKSIVFLCANGEISEKEVKKAISFIIAIKISTNKFNQRREGAL